MNTKELKKIVYKKRKSNRANKDNIAHEISSRILEARIRKGLSQKELAELIGTKQPAIARMESGDSLPTISQLEKVAKALGTELILPTFSCLNPAF